MTPRLNAIVRVLPRCKTFCDVGCDHGYIALAAAERKLCENLVITDVSAPSLKKAETLLRRHGISYKSFVTDGLDGVDNVDCAAICGMGGYEILSILERSKPETLVLQPMRDVVAVRDYLAKNGYTVEKDFIVKSQGKFYDIIRATRSGCEVLSERRRLFGLNDQQANADFSEYLKIWAKKLKQITERQTVKNAEDVRKLQIIGELIDEGF